MHEQHALRHLTTADFAALGLESVAYVKSVTLDDGTGGFSIHAADGQEIAVMTDRDTAFAAVLQNDMEAVSVH